MLHCIPLPFLHTFLKFHNFYSYKSLKIEIIAKSIFGKFLTQPPNAKKSTFNRVRKKIFLDIGARFKTESVDIDVFLQEYLCLYYFENTIMRSLKMDIAKWLGGNDVVKVESCCMR